MSQTPCATFSHSDQVTICWLMYLFVWIDVDVAFDAFLSHVGPGVATHPLPLTLGALVLAKASFLPLVGCQSFPLGSGLSQQKNKNFIQL